MIFDDRVAIELANEYFEWMVDLMCGERFHNEISYRKLLTHLHDTKFVYLIPKDRNRAEDGMNLRDRYAFLYDREDLPFYIDGPCSVLEMMVALAIRCEENIMDDPIIGDRTAQWFWGMVVNLGLGSMVDERYDEQYVTDCLTRFLNREYEPNGKGGLFTVRHCKRDLRNVEIWYQLCWYLDGIT